MKERDADLYEAVDNLFNEFLAGRNTSKAVFDSINPDPHPVELSERQKWLNIMGLNGEGFCHRLGRMMKEDKTFKAMGEAHDATKS
jgi:hypothetical protein